MVVALVNFLPERVRDIQVWLDRSMLLPGKTFSRSGQLLAGFHAAYHALWMGDLHRLRIISELIQSSVKNPNTSLLHLLHAKNLEALVHDLVGAQGEQAMASVREGLDLARRHNLRACDFMLNSQGVFAALTLGDSAQAREYLARMQKATPSSRRFAWGYFQYASAALCMHEEEYSQALCAADKALDIAEQTGARFALPFFALAKAQACHENGEHGVCAKLMQRLDVFITDSGSRLQRFMWLISQAHFDADKGQEMQALCCLREGFALGRREGYLNMFLWRPKMMARLCVLALENGLEKDYARLLVRRRGLHPEHPPRHLPEWPWLYRIHTLGRFELFREEQPVRFVGKVQHKPLAMLKYLVGVGERGASEQQVCDGLWPNSDGDRARSAFTTTVSRLRQLMGGRDGITAQGGWVTLNGRVCWVDSWAFQELCDRLQRSQDHGENDNQGNDADILAVAKLYGAALQALDLYAGHFLPTDPDALWSIAPRELLRERFIRLVAFIGDALEQVEEWERARHCYLRALEVDDLQEEFYRRIINCAHRLGLRDEAHAYLRRCLQRLKEELGVTPSPRILEMAHSLRLLEPVQCQTTPDSTRENSSSRTRS